MNAAVGFIYAQNSIKSRNIDMHEKSVQHWFSKCHYKDVDDFYAKIYIFFKGTCFCNTGAGEKTCDFQNI